MRVASLAGSMMLMLVSPALAANGDHWVVTGDGVNVRARGEAGAPVLLQVNHNAAAVELGRKGDWVEVRLPDRDAEGWIHDSLLSAVAGPSRPAAEEAGGAGPAAPAPAAAPPAATPPAPSEGPDQQLAAVESGGALARFRDSVTYLNNRAVAAAGIDLFTGVKEAGDGAVQVTATEAWKNVPESGQDSFMRTLLDRWSAAAGTARPLRVQVVDQAGHVLKEKSSP
jgi:hypothetical protein